MRMLFVESLRKGLPSLLMACTLTACGPSETQNGPAFFTGSITVSPPSFTLSVGADMGTPPSPTPCVSNPASFPVFPFLITVLDERGQPVGNADIDIILGLAANTFGGFTTLIDGDNGDTVSDIGDRVPYSTTTDDFGNKLMFIQFLSAAGCEYGASMTVTSASLFASMDYTVSP
jgi:hypothetical protein